ncbi:MAG: hypothetical protein Q8P24_01995 [Desulfobacterales bacterium]|nr:hypothetical protein [Desulfobacterales bacterium]
MTAFQNIDTEVLKKMGAGIADLRKAAESLEQNSADFPAVHRNVKRILASVKMLEINVSEVLDL